MRTDDVVVVILQRLSHQFLDRLEAGEMHHGGATILGKDVLDRLLVSNIAFNADQRLVTNCPDAIQRHRTAVAEIIKNDDLLARIQ